MTFVANKRFMFRRVLISLSITALTVCVWAQSGTIKGNVKDIVSGDAIIGANVIIMGTAQGAQADIEGNFVIPKVKAGTYSLVISFVSYKTDTLNDITVYPDQTTVVNATIMEAGQELNEIVITGARVTNTDLSVITEIRKSDLVAVGISAYLGGITSQLVAIITFKSCPTFNTLSITGIYFNR